MARCTVLARAACSRGIESSAESAVRNGRNAQVNDARYNRGLLDGIYANRMQITKTASKSR